MDVVRGVVGVAWSKDPGDTPHSLQVLHLPELVVVRPGPGFSCQASGKAHPVGLGLGFPGPWDCHYGAGPSWLLLQGAGASGGVRRAVVVPQHPLAKERV